MREFQQARPQEKQLVHGAKARKLLDREMQRARRRGQSIQAEIDFHSWVKPFVIVAECWYRLADLLHIPHDRKRAAKFVVTHGVKSVGVSRKSRSVAA